MRLDLAKMAKANGYKRKKTVFKAILPPQAMGQELARILISAGPEVWAAALPAINRAYEQALSQLQRDSANDVKFEIDSAAATAGGVFVEITTRVISWVRRVEAWHRGKFVSLINAANVDLSTVLFSGDVAETMSAIVERNVSLIKDVSAQAQGKISDIVFRGLQKRTPARDVAKELRNAVGFARDRSIRIASDQLQKLTSTLDRERMAQVGLDEYEWQHSGKLHYRPEHRARNGKDFNLGEPKGDEPGDKIFCGCKRKPILSLED